MKYFTRSVTDDFAAPGKYARLCAGSLCLFDLAIPNVKERKARPGKLIVRPKFDRLFACLDRFRIVPVFHQRHPERMPSIEKAWKLFDASSVFLDGSREFANGQVAVRVVKKFFNFRRNFFHSFLSGVPGQSV